MKQAIELLQRALKDVETRIKYSEEKQKRITEQMNYEIENCRNFLIKQKGLEEAIKLLEKVKQ